jgi:hypothetical protein
MPRGHSSASIAVADTVITCDYRWHSYTETNGPRNASQSFLDWEPVGYYINDTSATFAEVKQLAPRINDLFDAIIQDRH